VTLDLDLEADLEADGGAGVGVKASRTRKPSSSPRPKLYGKTSSEMVIKSKTPPGGSISFIAHCAPIAHRGTAVIHMSLPLGPPTLDCLNGDPAYVGAVAGKVAASEVAIAALSLIGYEKFLEEDPVGQKKSGSLAPTRHCQNKILSVCQSISSGNLNVCVTCATTSVYKVIRSFILNIIPDNTATNLTALKRLFEYAETRLDFEYSEMRGEISRSWLEWARAELSKNLTTKLQITVSGDVKLVWPDDPKRHEAVQTKLAKALETAVANARSRHDVAASKPSKVFDVRASPFLSWTLNYKERNPLTLLVATQLFDVIVLGRLSKSGQFATPRLLFGHNSVRVLTSIQATVVIERRFEAAFEKLRSSVGEAAEAKLLRHLKSTAKKGEAAGIGHAIATNYVYTTSQQCTIPSWLLKGLATATIDPDKTGMRINRVFEIA